MPLQIEEVSRIHFQGGSILRTSREHPARDERKLAKVIAGLKKHHIDCLVTIGGDGTAFSSSQVEKRTGSAIRVVHVPKTIDNDLPLPGSMPAVGYETARSVGADIIHNLMEDARTSSHWFFVVTMGRQTGHLALGIGKAAGATLTLIPEEFRQRKTTLAEVCDTLEGAIIKRLAMGRPHGVAVIAEGLASRLTENDLLMLEKKNLASLNCDEFGNCELSEVDLGSAIKDELKRRLAAKNIAVKLIDKTIGYEVRSAPPVPFDCEYTRDLGYAAIRFLASGGSGAMVCIQAGKMLAIPFPNIIAGRTKTRVRYVDIATESYEVARKYMIRLTAKDFADKKCLARLAKHGGYTVPAFTRKFAHCAKELPA